LGFTEKEFAVVLPAGKPEIWRSAPVLGCSDAQHAKRLYFSKSTREKSFLLL
jgi:hypothetical protein